MIEFSDFNMILILALGVAIGNLISFAIMAFVGAFITTCKEKKK